MYTIGTLSKKTGVTIRTLDYYDQIGLLSPHNKTEGGIVYIVMKKCSD